MKTSLLLVFVSMLAGLPMIGMGVYLVYRGMTLFLDHKAPVQWPGLFHAMIEKFSAATLRKAMVAFGTLMILMGLALPAWVWLRMVDMLTTPPGTSR